MNTLKENLNEHPTSLTESELNQIVSDFEQLHLQELKYRPKVRNAQGRVSHIATWNKISDFCKEQGISYNTYFSFILDWRNRQGVKRIGANWYGTARAFDIYKMHSSRHQRKYKFHVGLASEIDIMKEKVRVGIRLIAEHFPKYQDGILTRKALSGSIPAVFFAIDSYWPQVCDSVSASVRKAVDTERLKIIKKPTYYLQLMEVYSDWKRVAFSRNNV